MKIINALALGLAFVVFLPFLGFIMIGLVLIEKYFPQVTALPAYSYLAKYAKGRDSEGS